ncbi:hypothetical protein HanPSC8_Chr13g0546391 [Helianthus annuus]|nr:hypothetical protein HanPSC8_Chr13g0546391 [Helianthus annuus]
MWMLFTFLTETPKLSRQWKNRPLWGWVKAEEGEMGEGFSGARLHTEGTYRSKRKTSLILTMTNQRSSTCLCILNIG